MQFKHILRVFTNKMKISMTNSSSSLCSLSAQSTGQFVKRTVIRAFEEWDVEERNPDCIELREVFMEKLAFELVPEGRMERTSVGRVRAEEHC